MDIDQLRSQHGDRLLKATCYRAPHGPVRFAKPVLHCSKENVLIVLGTEDSLRHRSAAGAVWPSRDVHQLLLQEGLLSGAVDIDEEEFVNDTPVIEKTDPHAQFIEHAQSFTKSVENIAKVQKKGK